MPVVTPCDAKIQDDPWTASYLGVPSRGQDTQSYPATLGGTTINWSALQTKDQGTEVDKHIKVHL